MPLGDRVLVKPLSPEEIEGKTTSFGIIIPDTAKEKPEQGRVVAVGPGKYGDDNKLIPVSVKVGDRIMFNKYGYDEVKVEGVEYYIVSEQNILAVIN
ncbi:MAG TPA: co-chaperone GroES [Candidatus Paceibacterota bacterium]|nr:co-chaperone GroES [Candidatus Paceibacterota bacterium]